MTQEQFTNWLGELIAIWEQKTPENITQLCAGKFLWQETPFDEPLTTKEELLSEWQSILLQEDIRVSYDVLSLSGDVGIAHWHASFVQLPKKERVELDGIFKIVFNNEGRCIEFWQWYNTKDE